MATNDKVLLSIELVRNPNGKLALEVQETTEFSENGRTMRSDFMPLTHLATLIADAVGEDISLASNVWIIAGADDVLPVDVADRLRGKGFSIKRVKKGGVNNA